MVQSGFSILLAKEVTSKIKILILYSLIFYKVYYGSYVSSFWTIFNTWVSTNKLILLNQISTTY